MDLHNIRGSQVMNLHGFVDLLALSFSFIIIVKLAADFKVSKE